MCSLSFLQNEFTAAAWLELARVELSLGLGELNYVKLAG